MNSVWDDSLWALAALAVDPGGVKGIWLKTSHGPATQEWLHWLYALRPDTLKMPCNVDTERLLGGLDLSMTLQLGKTVNQSGLLVQSHSRLLLCPMAERIAESSASIISQVLDTKEVHAHYAHETHPSVFGFIAMDESTSEERGVSLALREQLGIWLDLNPCTHKDLPDDATLDMLERVERQLLSDPLSFKAAIEQMDIRAEDVRDFCNLAMGFSIDSLRAPWFALRLARVLAVLRGSTVLEMQDLGRAARLVLTPRALSLPPEAMQEEMSKEMTKDKSAEDSQDKPPPSPPPAPEPTPTPPAPPTQPSPTDEEPLDRPNGMSTQDPGLEEGTADDTEQEELSNTTPQALQSTVMEAALATLPLGLLKQLASGHAKSKNNAVGRSGALQKAAQRGRPLPALKGLPRQGHRLHVLATLRHAAPRQKIRSLEVEPMEPIPSALEMTPRRIKIRSEDFHVQRFAKRSESCIIFCIDASGSAALERLAEAKGAVELLLKDSYARRDHICVIAFRDKQAQVHLPITRSLVRAKRQLQALPGGGGTPLAQALKLCALTSEQARQHGMTPTLVVLSDGRANVTLEGEGSRVVAKSQALTWAQHWRRLQCQSIWLDTSARPDPQAQEIAKAMQAHYVPLPHANSQKMAQAVHLLKDQVH